MEGELCVHMVIRNCESKVVLLSKMRVRLEVLLA